MRLALAAVERSNPPQGLSRSPIKATDLHRMARPLGTPQKSVLLQKIFLMKVLFFAPLFLLAACGGQQNSTATDAAETEPVVQYSYFGDSIATDNAVAAADLIGFLDGRDSAEVTVKGEIAEVCQMKGCWMDMAIGSDTMTVRFKDYGFFVPKDAGGKPVVIAGFVERKEESVEWLKHKAQDAGKPQEEIDAITEPKISYAFTANGVAIAE